MYDMNIHQHYRITSKMHKIKINSKSGIFNWNEGISFTEIP